jgi:hypothetical protein
MNLLGNAMLIRCLPLLMLCISVIIRMFLSLSDKVCWFRVLERRMSPILCSIGLIEVPHHSSTNHVMPLLLSVSLFCLDVWHPCSWKGYQSTVQTNLPSVDLALLAIEFDIKHTYLIMLFFSYVGTCKTHMHRWSAKCTVAFRLHLVIIVQPLTN